MHQFDPQEALSHAQKAAQWAGVRYSREVTQSRAIRNDSPDSNHTSCDEGAMCEVLVDGHFGYAATADLRPEGLKRAFDQAIATTRAMAPYKVHAFTEAQRAAVQGRYTSPAQSRLSQVPLAQVTQCLQQASRAMALSEQVVSRSAHATLVQTQIDYYASNGTQTTQQFDMVDILLAATAAEGVQSQTRSWNQTGQFGGEVFDAAVFAQQGQRVAEEALALLAAPNCPTGTMDLILMPDQMMLQIHESIGHPLELDRILGDERNYAGWSFVQPSDFGQLRYGSELMNVTFDPTTEHALASYAFDDGGHPAQREFLIEGGILRRGLGSVESQVRSGLPGVANFRSAAWNRAPIDRMANINLEPGSSDLQAMIASVEHGVLMATNRSWSIDDYRNKFQFGCEYGRIIRKGQLGEVVRNPNYRGITVDFWRRLAAVGQHSEVFGTLFCGKGEPSQVIRVGHASPPCLFRGVEVFGGQA
ncbi:TldD/PmbA family protein [Ideonella paludis]|uniref:TldD/PmbA family protein n=1 Tax=Ideonella paludis TaxID=1233411 RepID=A0ABS5DSP6_9BURK|nr:TldD/PmbA family protein [Ideonella paludis]MBQ0934162.1 TldD/PmbA family protein [Ideonella paludis]